MLMKKIALSVAGAVLCLTLSGCSGNDATADGGQAVALQNMAVDLDRENASAKSAQGGAELESAPRANESDGIQGAIQPEGVSGGIGAAIDSEESCLSAADPAALELQGRDLEEIKGYLSGYPDSLQKLTEAECYVILHGTEHSGREYLDAFLENVNAGNPSELTIVQFTVEGDPIFLYLNADAENVYAVEDISRDKMGGSGEKYFEKTFDSVWLAREKDAGNYYISLYALQEQDMIVTVFTAAVDEPDADDGAYGLPPWAKPPAP